MMIDFIMCVLAGVILASGGMTVLNSWQAWAIIAIVAINGKGWTWGIGKR